MTGVEAKTLMHPYYSRDAYVKAYELAINLINGSTNWKRFNKVPICAPKKLKLLCRPKNAGRRESNKSRIDFKGCTRLSRKDVTRMTYSKCH